MSERKQMSMDSLLQILQDSLRQKLEILAAIEVKSRQQAELLTNPDVSLEVLDQNMDEKAVLVEEISKLDAGFEVLYESIREELIGNKDAYKEQIMAIQAYVAGIMDRSASIEAIESRNKAAIEMIFQNRRKTLQHKKAASSVARQYQKTAKSLNVVNPHFVDSKK